jgi:hypothetical protein
MDPMMDPAMMGMDPGMMGVEPAQLLDIDPIDIERQLRQITGE